MKMQRLVGLVVAGLLPVACATAQGSAGQDTAPSSPALGPATSSAPPSSAATPFSPATPAAPAGQPPAGPAPDHVVFVGDSFARQFFEAGRVLLAERPDVDVRYLISAGPAFAGEDWPVVVAEFVPEPERSAVLISFGTWQSTPPPDRAEQLADADLDAEIGSYLAPLAALPAASAPSLMLRPTVDDAEANERLQQANAATRPRAEAIGLDVYDVTLGELSVGARPAVEVATGDQSGSLYPLRTPLDPTHYCPAAALVMVREGLARHGLELPVVTAEQVDALFEATDGLGLFIADGCQAL